MKKIIPALVMLIISAVVLSTASYAWFSMNGIVYVSGMLVHAVGSGDLQISASNQNADFKSTLVFPTEDVGLRPASTPGTLDAGQNHPAFYYVSDGKGIASNEYSVGEGTVFAKDNPTLNPSDDTYKSPCFLMDAVYVRYFQTNDAATTSKTLRLKSISLDESRPQEILDSSLRVMLIPYTASDEIKGGDRQTPLIYRVTGTGEWHAVAMEGTVEKVQNTGTELKIGAATTAAESFKKITPNTSSDAIISMEAGNVYRIDIYVWYEGQDITCTSVSASVALPAMINLELTTEDISP